MKGRGAARAWQAGLPALLWICGLLLLPLVLVLAASLLSRGDYGGLARPWTLENYKRLAGFGLLGFDPVYPIILGRSLVLGAVTTVLCAAAAVPLALYLMKLPPRWRGAALTLFVAPFWTNLLVRTYGWQILLNKGGWLSSFLQSMSLPVPNPALSPGPAAVYLCMACDYLPFMLLPVYAAAAALDERLVEAARDLGARRLAVFRHAIWPQLYPGIASGAALVFLPAAGQFVIPDLLGGAKTVFAGGLLQQQFGSARDWPFGAAIGVLFIALMLGAWRVAKARLPAGIAR